MLGDRLPLFGSTESEEMKGDYRYTLMTRNGKSSQPNTLRTLVLRLFPHLFISAVFVLGILIGTHYPTYLSIYTRKSAQETISLLPQSLPPAPASLQPPIPALPAPLDPIPNLVHYVYGLAEGEQPEFPYFAYLAMRSAMMVLEPEKIMFHCINEPQGYWWDRVKNWEGWTDENGQKKGYVEVVEARDIQWIGTTQRPVHNYAHKADILRLEVLLEHGGVYLDIDTFVIRPFSSANLYSYDAVLGMEARKLDVFRGPGSDNEMDPKGLCNAIIVSRPGATFVERWLQSYETFDDKDWTHHSVAMPWTLAKLYPTTVTVLSDRAFFWPLWTDDHISPVHTSTEYDFDASGQLAYHAWESMAKEHLLALDPETIMTTETSFTRMARRFRESGEEVRWRAMTGQESQSDEKFAMKDEGMGFLRVDHKPIRFVRDV